MPPTYEASGRLEFIPYCTELDFHAVWQHSDRAWLHFEIDYRVKEVWM